jgi:Flp pilus assembly protein CpaB
LTTAQAEILNLASDQGKIRLALRNRTDLAEQTTRGVDTSNLLGSDSEKKEAPKGATPNQKNVEMIKGLARSRVNL